jgi:hypothetical protein
VYNKNDKGVTMKKAKKKVVDVDGQFVKINGEWYALIKLGSVVDSVKPLFSIDISFDSK